MSAEGIGYIKVSRFAKTTTEELRIALDDLKKNDQKNEYSKEKNLVVIIFAKFINISLFISLLISLIEFYPHCHRKNS